MLKMLTQFKLPSIEAMLALLAVVIFVYAAYVIQQERYKARMLQRKPRELSSTDIAQNLAREGQRSTQEKK